MRMVTAGVAAFVAALVAFRRPAHGPRRRRRIVALRRPAATGARACR